MTVTPANHGDQFLVPIPHSALKIIFRDGEDYRAIKACFSGASAVILYPIIHD
jgi:hypothetical protein